MASPQKENGYTSVANEISEAFARTYFSSQESRILWTILRKTYGYINKKKDQISFSQFEKFTEMERRNVSKALKKLLERNIIYREIHGQLISYGLQKDYDLWDKPLSKQTIVKSTKTIVQTDNILLSKQTTEPLSKQTNTKQKPNKKQIKRIIIPNELIVIEGFSEIWKDWIQYREEIKKPLTPTSAKRQFNKLIKFKSKGHSVLNIIDEAIVKHWQDFYEPKDNLNYRNNGHEEDLLDDY